ncbi:MAG: lipopolysaccharide biosynthesis protein, partial [Polyangiaceae bacterium]|nr:lipopolysaccharide biosynthesis protein [Polyangiaceae bacterium]
MNTRQDEASRAGRGLLSIAGAKVYFILAGFIVQFSLPRLFGSPEVFGFFSVATSGISIINNVLIAATIQSVSKFVSADEAHAPAVLRQGLALQAALGLAIFGGILLGAEPLAAFMRDRSLAPLLRVAAIVTLSYAIYATLIGHLNGLRLFGRQARFDVTFTTLRTVGMLGGAGLGFGALGAMTGFASAAAAIAALALFGIGMGERGPSRAPIGAWLGFMAPIWAYQGCLNGVLQVDLWVLKKTAAELGATAGLGLAAAAAEADRYAGFYRGAQTFAFVPYQLVLATTFIVFPTVSRATALGDEEAARRAVSGSLRFSVLALLAMAAPIAGAAEGLLRFAYGAEYVAGAPALRILAVGLVAFTLFVVSATAMGGSGRPIVSAGIAAVGLIV